MGILNSVKKAAKSAVRSAAHSVARPAQVAAQVARKVEAAPRQAARGASQALAGVANLGKKAVKKASRHVVNAAATVQRTGRSAIRQARKGVDMVRRGASEVAAAGRRNVARVRAVAKDVRHRVEAAPRTAARGALQALGGVAALKTRAVRASEDIAKSGLKAAGAAAAVGVAGAATLGRHAREGADVLRRGVGVAAGAVGSAAKSTGRFLWEHKGEIGFYAVTTALLLAVPVSGGASGALAGGLLATRGASIAARVALAAKNGGTAARLAQTGATAVRGGGGRVAASQVGRVVAGGGKFLHTQRVALGGTKVGRGMLKAEPFVNAGNFAIAGVNFGETAVRRAQGKASNKDLGLSFLVLGAGGLGTSRAVATARATRANREAATIATNRMDAVVATTGRAQERVAHVAGAAPASAPKTMAAANEAGTQAGATIERAARVRDVAAASDPVKASALAGQVDGVATTARAARLRAAESEFHAPAPLTPAARAARRELKEAEALVVRTKEELQALGATQRRADRFADNTERTNITLGAASLNANLVNNSMTSIRDRARIAAAGSTAGTGFTSDPNVLVARSIVSALLGRNASVHAPASVPAAAAAPVR